ncbi:MULTISPECIES: oligosaccharide flippase family protein [Marinobacter]|uniref:oligosaccharide flippase family protein n=1 Tax=Marinobacter TaxID=2742 RepID=UPI001B0B2D8C|nr:oligosaccharide flippase family protein [Marinobacter sp.]MBO6813043.1 oligosaccharide flippase family protein [Marinobacter sp.]MBO6873081.1 oligosaccharide flippase family protein [Marinobacter sp.]
MSLSLQVIKSSGLLLGLQLIHRGLGIVSTLILARLLTPDHFGVVALVTIALQFFELLVETGNQQYIVQKSVLEDEDLNTAWTLDILSKTIIALIVIVASPLVAEWFQEPDLTIALAVASLALPIRALKTPGMFRLARQINYKPLFQLSLWQKGVSFVTVVTIAVIEPSYWAIIIGNLVAAVVFTVGSYRVEPYRPRWSLLRLREQWQFSQWLLLRGIVGFTRSQVDNLLVSKAFGTSQLGGYNLVREISLLPALSAIIPMSEPLLAAIANAKNEPMQLAFRVRLSLALMISALAPLTVFIMSYPDLIVRVLLGPDWGRFAPLLEPFGLFFFTFCLFALISDAIIAQGRVKLLFWFDVVSTLAIVVILWRWATHSLDAMAWWRGWLAIATTGVLLLILQKQVRFGLGRLTVLSIPALIGSGAGMISAMAMPVSEAHFLIRFFVLGSTHVLISAAVTVALASLLLKKTEEWGLITSVYYRMSKRIKSEN